MDGTLFFGDSPMDWALLMASAAAQSVSGDGGDESLVIAGMEDVASYFEGSRRRSYAG
jgi:hypothetical protein